MSAAKNIVKDKRKHHFFYLLGAIAVIGILAQHIQNILPVA